MSRRHGRGGNGSSGGPSIEPDSPVADFLPAIRYAINPLSRSPYRNVYFHRLNVKGVSSNDIANAAGYDVMAVEQVFNRLTGIADLAESLNNGGDIAATRASLDSAGKNLRAFAVQNRIMDHSLS